MFLSNLKRKLYFAFLSVFLLCCFWGCGAVGQLSFVNPLKDDQLIKLDDSIFTVAQAKILFAAQKKSVEAVFGSEIWEVEVGESDFNAQTKDSLKSLIAKISCMKTMAEDSSVTLSSTEKKQIENCVATYMEKLTAEEIAQLGITEEDVNVVFTGYYYVHKLSELLTKDVNTEISDKEARMMDVEYIYIKKDSEQVKKLKAIRKQAKASESFLTVARQYTEADRTIASVSYEDLDPAIADKVFALKTGAVSKILKGSDGYYIYHCTQSFNKKATREKKQSILEEEKNAIFQEAYDQFLEGKKIQFNDKAWEKLNMQDIPALSDANFFKIYEKEFE